MVRDIIANDVAAGFDFRFPLQQCPAGGMAYTVSLDLTAFGRPGSSPGQGTKFE